MVEEEEAPILPLIPSPAAKKKNKSVDRKTRATSLYEYMCM